MAFQKVQCRQSSGCQGWRQGCGVPECSAGLQQSVGLLSIAGEKGPTTSKGFAKGATDHGDALQAQAKPSPLKSKDPQSMGFIQEQAGAVVPTECGQGRYVRAGALHAEQAFADHHQACVRALAATRLKLVVQSVEIVVGEALQLGSAGLHSHQQRMVDQAIGQHRGVTVGQGQDRGEVRLKSARKQKHPVALQPLGQGRLQTVMHGPAACDQPGATGTDTTALQFGLGRGDQLWVVAEPEVVIAGQIHQGWACLGLCLGANDGAQAFTIKGWRPGAQSSTAGGWDSHGLYFGPRSPCRVRVNLLPFPSEAVTGLERFTLFFPLWTLLAALLSLLQPDLFTWVAGPVIVWSLALIMLGMGLGLSPADFRRAMIPPRAALIGVGAQFLVMPALAASLAWALKLEPPLAVGLILVGCCPGGTASNVVALIARADVALSVVMTSLSTLLAVVVTPLLTSALAGRYVPVDGWTLLVNVLQVVLVPVTVGVAIKQGLPRLAARVQPVMPPLAVVAIALIVAGIVGSQREVLLRQGGLLVLATALLHGGGFLLGFLLPALLGEPRAVRRTISIEVGMQNSGLAVVLARSGGFASPLTALPGAISAVMHSLLGSLLAALWRKRP